MTDDLATLVAEVRGVLGTELLAHSQVRALCDAVERLQGELSASRKAIERFGFRPEDGLADCIVKLHRAMRDANSDLSRVLKADLDAARRVARELLAECVEHNSEYGHVTNVAAYCAANPWLNVIA